MMKRSTWHMRASLVILAWMLAAAIVSLVHRQVPVAAWLMVHLLLLGAVSNALLIWSWHFAQAILRVPPMTRRVEAGRLAVFNCGAVLVILAVVLMVPWLVVAGGVLAIAALLLHVLALVRALRAALPSRFAVAVHYYVAAALLAVPGIALGVALTRAGTPALISAHAAIGLLGWVGLPILGTLLTLWPTMLHTRIVDGAERKARWALPTLVVGIGVVVGGLISGITMAAVAGVVLYGLGAGLIVAPMITEMRRKPPQSFAAWSTLCGVVWLGVALVVFAATVTEPGGTITVLALVGGVLQVLLGSLSYLVPVVMGGGPQAVRWRNARADRATTTRLIITNAGLALCVLPTPSTVRVAASVLVLGALLATAFTVAMTIRTPREPRPRRDVGVVTGLGAIMVAVVAGVAVNPAAVGSPSSAAGDVAPTGHTTTVQVTIEGMRFVPGHINVPAGDRLVVELTNTGDDAHDLTLETGQHTPRLQPGESATLDAGVVGRDVAGWCSLAGHRQMGMVLGIHVGGAPAMTTPEPVDAVLQPASTTKVHRLRLEAREVQATVAPGVEQTRWTFNGTVPGPVLRGQVGDRFIVTLVNSGTMGHSIDFHAGALAPDEPMRTIAPGESLTYRFTATRAGIWMYHCSTMPMSLHIANGMFGAVIIDPPDLPDVDREYVLVQSESYLGDPHMVADRIAADEPDQIVFNGFPNQYDEYPLHAMVGERVRLWVLDAGPNRSSAFHVVGGQFDTVYREGAYDLRPGPGGSQVLGLFPAQGGFVELEFPQAGHYPFVTHAMSDAERGAHGVIAVH